jgi:hypothetical protein
MQGDFSQRIYFFARLFEKVVFYEKVFRDLPHFDSGTWRADLDDYAEFSGIGGRNNRYALLRCVNADRCRIMR